MTEEKKPTLTLDKEPTRQVRSEPERTNEVRYSKNKTRRKNSADTDALFVEPSEIPDGFTVEWKRVSIYGQEDKKHIINTEKDGWEPAHPKDFPSLVGKNHSGNYILGGQSNDLMLMIRPVELTEEARREDYQRAVGQVNTKFQEIGMSKPGELPREDSTGKKLVKVARSYERIPVSD